MTKLILKAGKKNKISASDLDKSPHKKAILAQLKAMNLKPDDLDTIDYNPKNGSISVRMKKSARKNVNNLSKNKGLNPSTKPSKASQARQAAQNRIANQNRKRPGYLQMGMNVGGGGSTQGGQKRHPKGSTQGGQFAKKPITGYRDKVKDAVRAAKDLEASRVDLINAKKDKDKDGIKKAGRNLAKARNLYRKMMKGAVSKGKYVTPTGKVEDIDSDDWKKANKSYKEAQKKKITSRIERNRDKNSAPDGGSKGDFELHVGYKSNEDQFGLHNNQTAQAKLKRLRDEYVRMPISEGAQNLARVARTRMKDSFIKIANDPKMEKMGWKIWNGPKGLERKIVDTVINKVESDSPENEAIKQTLERLVKHKKGVHFHAQYLGLSFKRNIEHDLSKLDEPELVGTALKYSGLHKNSLLNDMGKNAREIHKLTNPHHSESWIDSNGKPQPMSDDVVKEMLADWMAHYKVDYSKGKEAFDDARHQSQDWWIKEGRERLNLHPDTIKKVEDSLWQGEKERNELKAIKEKEQKEFDESKKANLEQNELDYMDDDDQVNRDKMDSDWDSIYQQWLNN